MSAPFLLLIALTCQTEPLRDSMRAYVADFESASTDAERLSTAIRARYPETWYTCVPDAYGSDSVTSVFGAGPTHDTALVDTLKWFWKAVPLSGQRVLRFDYEAMYSARDGIRLAVQNLAPRVNAYLKTARVRDDLEVFDSLDSLVGTFKTRLDRLRQFHWVIRLRDTAFMDSVPVRFDGRHLKSLHRWSKIALALRGMQIRQGLERYEIRYGSTSEQLNFLELLLSNALPPFRGNQRGPSAFEPIFLRLTPACYNLTDNRQAWLAQLLGVNGYLFGDDWFAHSLSHFGISHLGFALTAADVTGSPFISWPPVDSLAWGAVLHIGKFQIGAVTDFRKKLKVISTVDFHIIPGFIL
jgi:hypothetical protein